MKPLNLIINMCSFLLLMFLAFSCTKEDPLTLDNFNSELNKQVVVTGPIDLIGETHFPSYAVKEHRVISPWELNKLTCEATLTMGKGQNFTLDTKEYFGPDLFREISFEGKITPSGVVSFSWPEQWLEFGQPISDLFGQFYLHTGCIPYGPGVNINQETWIMNYKGTFDGKSFNAKVQFLAKQEVLGIIPFYADSPIIEGPIQFEFTIELEVD